MKKHGNAVNTVLLLDSNVTSDLTRFNLSKMYLTMITDLCLPHE